MKNYMLYENRLIQRCLCGCNVFRKSYEKDGIIEYTCNSCKKIIRGRKQFVPGTRIDEPMICDRCGKDTDKGKFHIDEGHQEHYFCKNCAET